MSYYFNVYDVEQQKLERLLLENNLVYEFSGKTYPVRLTISPDASPAAQMELFAASDDGASSQDARLVFTFPVGKIGVKVTGRLVMPDALMNKIKNIAKKMHKAYVEGFFATHMAARKATEPEPDEDATPVAEAEASFDEFFEDDEDES